MEMSKILKNRKYLAINLILFAILYLSVTFNKEFIRPVYGNSPIIGIITGSFSNFMAAYIISLFPIAPILSKNIEIKKARLIVYATSILVFMRPAHRSSANSEGNIDPERLHIVSSFQKSN